MIFVLLHLVVGWDSPVKVRHQSGLISPVRMEKDALKKRPVLAKHGGIAEENLKGVVISADAARLEHFQSEWPKGIPLEVSRGTQPKDLALYENLFSWKYHFYEWANHFPRRFSDPGAKLVAAAHHKALESVAEKPDGWYMIFEDDASLSMDMHRFASRIQPDAKYIDLNPISKEGPGCHDPTVPGFSEYAKCRSCYGQVGYALKPSTAREVMDNVFPLSEPIDIAICRYFLGQGEHSGNYLSLDDSVVQGPFESLKHARDDVLKTQVSLLPHVPDIILMVGWLSFVLVNVWLWRRDQNVKDANNRYLRLRLSAHVNQI